MNIAIISGNLGKDVEFKTISTGTSTANFSVATTKKVKDVPVTTWHRVVAFGFTADACVGLKKGARVLVQGEIQNRQYKDKDGQEKTISEILAYTVGVVPRTERGTGVTKAAIVPSFDQELDNIPF